MSDTEVFTKPKPAIVEELVFVDAIPGSPRTGRPDIFAGVIEKFLPALQANAGKAAAIATDVTNSVTTRLNKEHGGRGLKFSFRAAEGTDGKRGTLYAVYTGPVEIVGNITVSEVETAEPPVPKGKGK